MHKSDTRKSIIERRKYRKDINGDAFSLYISSYPITVDYLKKRIGNKNKILVELCCGVGVTLEHIAKGFKHVIGVDIDHNILTYCRKNLEHAGLSQKTTLIQGDVTDSRVLKTIKADIVIYDIPFWSPHEFKKQGDLTRKNPSLKSIIDNIRRVISKDIVVFCSPQFDYEMVKKEIGPCEFQKVFIDGKYDRNHIYLGKLKRKTGITTLRLKSGIHKKTKDTI